MEEATEYLAWHFKVPTRSAAAERQLQTWGEEIADSCGGEVTSRSVRDRGIKPGDQIMSVDMYLPKAVLHQTILRLADNAATTAIELQPWGASHQPTRTHRARDGLVFTTPRYVN